MMFANRTAFCSVFLPCHLVYLVHLVLSQPESKKPTLVREMGEYIWSARLVLLCQVYFDG